MGDPPPTPAPPIVVEPHPLPAANPTQTHLSTPSHPPYAEMITTAITVLDSKKGSSKKAIAKYLTQAYGDRHLPAAHLGLLTHHLKRLKNSGALIMLKKSYKINKGGGIGVGNPKGDIEGVGPRRRGRPPKVVGMVRNVSFGGGLVKRLPGRPRKEKVENGSVSVPLSIVPIDHGVGMDNRNLVPVVKRGRGRPPKSRINGNGGGGSGNSVGLELVVPAVETLERRGRGRPRKNPNEFSYLKPAAAMRKRGRLPLIGKAGSKRRGRPPLIRKVGVKCRGRPPKTAAALLVPGGCPVGRPKKNAPLVRDSSTLQAEELTRKLEFMRACIKSAVRVLQPHVNQNAVDAVSALNRLEELTTMSINPSSEFIAPARLLPVAISVPPPINRVLSLADFSCEQPTFSDSEHAVGDHVTFVQVL